MEAPLILSGLSAPSVSAISTARVSIPGGFQDVLLSFLPSYSCSRQGKVEGKDK